jgi:hypothetical protein
MDEEQLRTLKKLVSSFTLARDIEDVVFDYNGQKPRHPNDCLGRRVIDFYNTQVITENINNYKHFGRKTGLEKETFELTDTKYFSINSTNSFNGSSPESITTYYFKNVIIIEIITNANSFRPNPPTYKGFRHYFTPDILLFLKYFHQNDKTERAMEYIKQNPHYFKHHTVDSIEIFRKVNETINEMIEENRTKSEYLSNLEKNIIELKQQNQTLQNKITEMEENNKRSESPLKFKIE